MAVTGIDSAYAAYATYAAVSYDSSAKEVKTENRKQTETDIKKETAMEKKKTSAEGSKTADKSDTDNTETGVKLELSSSASTSTSVFGGNMVTVAQGWKRENDGSISTWTITKTESRGKTQLQKMNERMEEIRLKKLRKKAQQEKRMASIEKKKAIEERRKTRKRINCRV